MLIVFPLFSYEAEPAEYIAVRTLPAASLVISLLSIVLPSFPLPALAVENRIIPLDVFVSAPFILQYFTILFSAVFTNRIVDVPAVDDVLDL